MIHKIMDFYNVFFVFLGASMGTGAPRNTHKIRTQCGYEYGCKSHESLVTLETMFGLWLLLIDVVLKSTLFVA